MSQLDQIREDIHVLSGGMDDMTELVMEKIEQWGLEQRIDEVRKFVKDWGEADEHVGDGSWEDYTEYRIAELKALRASQEKSKREEK